MRVPEPVSEPIVKVSPRISSVVPASRVSRPPRIPELPRLSVPAVMVAAAVVPLTPPMKSTPLPVFVTVPLRTPALRARPI